eukprot:256453_1
MIRRLRRILEILLLSALLLFKTHHREKRGPYQVFALISGVQILSQYDLFYRCTRFCPQVFVQHLYGPIQSDLDCAREYYLIPSIVQRRRRKPLPKLLRCIRFCMRYSGWPTATLILIFGQSQQTIDRDCVFIAQIIVHKLYTKYVHLAYPGTPEYASWLGCGVFESHFPTMLYAIDIMRIPCNKPRTNQRDFFDGHIHSHAVGIGAMCNGDGIPCYVSRAYSGHTQDGTIWQRMKRRINLNRYVLPHNYIAADRIFRYEDPPILTHYTAHDHFTMEMLLFNYQLSSSRIIIENMFGRFKTIFPIFRLWTFGMEHIDLYIECGMVMLSIILKHQAPLRTN